MASLGTSSGLIPLTESSGQLVSATPTTHVRVRRRKISPQTGRAIEMLGHAIDYLSDEHSLECSSQAAPATHKMDPRMAAIQLLMTRSRELYLSCPEIPTFADRLRSLLHA